MATAQSATRAYAQGQATRGLRAQEADVFHRVNAALRRARHGSELDRIRAFADNALLWTTVAGVAADPENRLPPPLRASLISIGRAVGREMRSDTPDFGFLVRVNDDIAAGLAAA